LKQKLENQKDLTGSLKNDLRRQEEQIEEQAKKIKHQAIKIKSQECTIDECEGQIFDLNVLICQNEALSCDNEGTREAYSKWIISKLEQQQKPDGEGDCSVCQGVEEEEGNMMIFVYSCGHLFHPQCIKDWLKEMKFSCPYCRSS